MATTGNLDAVFSALKTAVKAVPGAAGARFVLFGSRARGDFDSDSDIDVAIIVPGLTSEVKHAILDAVAEVEYARDVVLSTLVISLENFEWLKRRERRIALDIENEGVRL